MEYQKKVKSGIAGTILLLVLAAAAVLTSAYLYRKESAENDEAAGQIEELSSDVFDLEAEIRELNRQIAALENEVTDTNEDYSELRDEHEDLRSDYTDLHTDYSELREEHSALKEDVGSISGELSEKESALSEAEEELASMERRAAALEKRLTRQISRYEEAVTDKEALAGEIAALTEEITRLEADISRLRTENAPPVPEPEPAPAPVTIPSAEEVRPAYIPSGEVSEAELMRLLRDGVPPKWYRDTSGGLYPGESQFVSYAYYDLTDGTSMGYRADEVYYSASLIKAPYIYSVLLEISEFERTAERDADGAVIFREGEEKYNLDEEWTFDPETMMEEGSGEIKEMPAGTQMTWRELFSYVLLWSDNIALNQIMERFGFDSFYRLVGELGICGTSSDFMDLSAEDCVKFLREICAYFETGDPNAQFMKEMMMQSKHDVMICASFPEDTVPHKYGWDIDSYHDMAIIYDSHPYIIVIMTDLHDGTDEDNAFVHSVVEMTKQLHAARHGG